MAILEKKVFFIEFKDYSSISKKFFFVDGVVHPGEGEGASNYSKRFGDIEDCMGEFFSIFINSNGEVEVGSDFCGFYSLFWKKYTLEDREGVLVSNCFHSISLYSEHNFDASKVIPNLISKNQIFIQDYSNKTCLKDVSRLGWDERIKISKLGFKLEARSPVISESYKSLISKGVEKAQRTLESQDEKRTLNLYLSGGKDSRAILALLLSMGKQPKCTTQPPDKFKGKSKDIVMKDFRIASFLVRRYGLKWFRGFNKGALKLSFNESLEQHAFFRSGYFLFTPSQYLVYDNKWNEEVQLRGGGGGLYKSTWGEYIKNSYINKWLVGSDLSLKEDAGIIFKKLVPEKGLPQNIYSSSQEVFINSLSNTIENNESSNVYSALDIHHVSYRNRSHFGHLRNSEAQGKVVFYPLINEHFYNASLLLSDEERSQGKLVFDIIEHCFSELNEYPYDDGYHELLPQERLRKEISNYDVSIDEFLEVQESNKDTLKGIFLGTPFDSQLEERDFIDKALEEVFVSLNIDGKRSDEFISFIDELKNEKKFRGKLCSVLSSLPLESVSDFSYGHLFIDLVGKP